MIPTIDYSNDPWIILVAGLVLSVINFILKPILVIVTLPFIAISLGLFLVVINGFLVWLMSTLVGSFDVTGFGSAILAGIIIGLVNYAVSTLLEDGKVLRDENDL